MTALFRQIRRAHQQLNQAPAASPSVPAAAPAPAAASDPEAKSKADTLTCYATLASLQGRQFELNERATFVGAAHSDVVKYGHITTVPSVKDVKVLGTTSTQRQRVGFANPANNASSVVATMEFNGITASVDPHDDAKIRASTRHLVHGLLAALGGEIGAAHYGGRDVGWVTPPGRTVQVRVGASASAFDKWMWEVVSSPLRGPAYLRMVSRAPGTARGRSPRVHAGGRRRPLHQGPGSAARGRRVIVAVVRPVVPRRFGFRRRRERRPRRRGAWRVPQLAHQRELLARGLPVPALQRPPRDGVQPRPRPEALHVRVGVERASPCQNTRHSTVRALACADSEVEGLVGAQVWGRMLGHARRARGTALVEGLWRHLNGTVDHSLAQRLTRFFAESGVLMTRCDVDTPMLRAVVTSLDMCVSDIHPSMRGRDTQLAGCRASRGL